MRAAVPDKSINIEADSFPIVSKTVSIGVVCACRRQTPPPNPRPQGAPARRQAAAVLCQP